MEKVFTTITLLSTVQALIYTGIFIAAKHNRSLKILGLFMFIYIGTNLQWIFKDVKYLPITFSYLVVPLFYVYVRSVLGIFHKKDYLHFIPAIIEFVFALPLFFYHPWGDELYTSGKYNMFLVIYMAVLPPLYNIVYAILAIRMLSIHKKLVPALYTQLEMKRLSWLFVTCIIFASEYLLEFLSSVALLATKFDVYLYIYQALGSAFIVYWISVYGLNQKNLLLEEARTNNENNTGIQQIPAHDDQVTDPAYQDKYLEIVRFFEKTKIYTNKEISLFMVADLLQMPYKEVSKTINLVSKKNFNQFVNEFRVEEAKRLIKSDKLEHYTLTAVAEEVGFNSRSTFFSAFKSIEGKTPTEYRKSSETGI